MSAFALAIVASPALAQGPAEDQYAPTTPSVDGGDTPEPVTATEQGGPPADTGSTGSGGDDSSAAATGGSGGGTDDPAVAPTATGEAAGTTANAVEQPKNQDKGTVESLAARGEEQRESAASSSGPSTNLASSDDGGEEGMGILLYGVLGLTLLWAIAVGVSRRRNQDGHPA